MRPTYARLIPILFLCAILASPSDIWALTTTGRSSFVVFDGLMLKNKPDLTRFGLSPLRIAYTSEIWGGSMKREQPNDEAVKNLAAHADSKVPLVLDIEHWNVQGGGDEVERNLRKLIEIVDLIHQTNPALKVGFFALVPISNPSLALHYALAEQNADIPYARAYVAAYSKLQEDDSLMRQLAEHVDFVCPALYTFYDLGGGSTKYQRSWDIEAKNSIDEAKQYGKPIYVFLWPQFYDEKDQDGDHTFIPAAFWEHELALVRSSGAQGAIIWGSTGFRKAGWKEDDPWWQVTQGFVSQLARP